MHSFVITSMILIVTWLAFAYLFRESLRQRGLARHYRAKFVGAASDLVGKADFPEDHARHLAQMAALPSGWATRLMVLATMKHAILGSKSRPGTLRFEDIPACHRPRYVTAMLSFTLADSYRTVLFGRAFRSIHEWMIDAVNDVKPDVTAHATRNVIEQVNHVPTPRKFIEADLVCA